MSLKSMSTENKNDSSSSFLSLDSAISYECAICYSKLSIHESDASEPVLVKLFCGHLYCLECILKLQKSSCPICRKAISIPCEVTPPQFVRQNAYIDLTDLLNDDIMEIPPRRRRRRSRNRNRRTSQNEVRYNREQLNDGLRIYQEMDDEINRMLVGENSLLSLDPEYILTCFLFVTSRIRHYPFKYRRAQPKYHRTPSDKLLFM